MRTWGLARMSAVLVLTAITRTSYTAAQPWNYCEANLTHGPAAWPKATGTRLSLSLS